MVLFTGDGAMALEISDAIALPNTDRVSGWVIGLENLLVKVTNVPVLSESHQPIPGKWRLQVGQPWDGADRFLENLGRLWTDNIVIVSVLPETDVDKVFARETRFEIPKERRLCGVRKRTASDSQWLDEAIAMLGTDPNKIGYVDSSHHGVVQATRTTRTRLNQVILVQDDYPEGFFASMADFDMDAPEIQSLNERLQIVTSLDRLRFPGE